AVTGQDGAPTSVGAAGVGTVVGVGTDLVAVDRLRTALERTPSLLHRLFTPAEQARCGRHADPLPHLAARFAAKEATMKALGRGMSAMSFTDVEVLTAADGSPSLRLTGRARQVADTVGVTSWLVSLTHDGPMAHAVVLART